MRKACLLFLLIAGLYPVSAAYAQRERFFEALYDVPVMPGLQELPEQALLFDKPEGRIASVTAGGKTLSQQDISDFYGRTLPQMGWRPAEKNVFLRHKDRLSLKYDVKDGLTFVVLTLEPDPARLP